MRKPDEIAHAFAPTSELGGVTRFFMVGMAGAGMSALARMLKYRGYDVQGSDSSSSPEAERLIVDGFKLRIGHSAEGLEPGMAIVVSDAIDLSSSPEVAYAQAQGLPIFRRSQVLGWILRDRKVIAVTGTHGKTTTTGMIGAGLQASGEDPLIVVGASVPQFGGPVVEGKGGWAVVEACEAYDSFHDIQPQLVVLTNLELDHVDFHGSYDSLRDSVVRFVDGVPADGWLIYCSEDRGASEVAELCSVRAMPYGISESWIRQSFNIMQREVPTDFDMRGLDASAMALPGAHNKLNAAGAIMTIMLTGADPAEAARGILGFQGAERRLQVLHDGEVTVIDDYAHHPTEIEASLTALRTRYKGRRIVVVYQPHLYSRTAPLVKEFARSLSLADVVVLTDIYPAREDPIPGVSSARIAEAVTAECWYVPSRHLLPREVRKHIQSGDVIVGMGAGSISEFAPAFLDELIRSPIRLPEGGRPIRRVAVIYGGDSAEREVSILTGRAIHEALRRLGHDSVLIDVTDLLFRKADVSAFVGANRPDVAFLAVHGTHAEDGAIQGFFEVLHIPYTGSGIQASALAMDKALAKQILAREGIRVPEGYLAADATDVPHGPWKRRIVKPNAQGSTVGLSFVERESDLQEAIERAARYGSGALVEEWVEGMEVSVPVLGDRALEPVEIAPTSGKYDFESKYTPGATEEICPARLPAGVLEELKLLALASHRALGCAGASRTDMIVRDPHGSAEAVVLEVNTLPGMTSTSLLPNSAAASGIPFDDLVQWLMEDALARAEAT